MTPAAATVLSPLPLDAEARTALLAEFGPDVRFLDLQALRRLSLPTLFTAIRAARASAVVVVGTNEELLQFRDYLLPLAAGVPGARHEIRTAGKVPIRISRVRALAPLFGRSLWALTAGCGAVVVTWCESLLRLAWHGGGRLQPTRMERCLYLKPSLNFGRPVGGSVAHVAGVVNALSRREIAVAIVASQPQGGVTSDVPQLVTQATFALSSSHELNQHRYRRRFTAAALAEARRWSPDFIYQRFALNDLSGARVRRALGIPLIVEFNGSEVWVQRHWGRRLLFERTARLAERAALRAADLVVVVSEEVGLQAIEAGVDRARILFHPNGVDGDEFDPARFPKETCRSTRASLGVPETGLLFTFVGTFGEWHGTDVLAEAILALRAEREAWVRESRAHFLFVGDGPRSAMVRERLRRVEAEGLVTFSGLRPHEETPGILAASDVLVSPHKPNADGSRFFGSPTKLFEYMAMARPIVASDLDQIGEVLRGRNAATGADERAGEPAAILVEPGDVSSLADGLLRAGAMNESDRRAMGGRAREIVLRRFTWDRNVAAVLGALTHARAQDVASFRAARSTAPR